MAEEPLRVSKSGRWSSEEILFLRKNCKSMKGIEIAERLGRSPHAVYTKIERLKIRDFTPNIKRLRKWQLAYLAGFIDGEGTLTIRRLFKKKWVLYHPHISIANTDRNVLETISKWLLKTGQDGTSYAFEMFIRRNVQLLLLLKALLPYLILKKPQAEWLITFCESRVKNHNRPYTEVELGCYQKIRQMNLPKTTKRFRKW